MVWGIQMSASQDHLLSPAHGHLNLLGWVSCAIYAFYYHLVPIAGEGTLPRLHLAATVLSLGLLVPGIPLAILEQTEDAGKSRVAGGAGVDAAVRRYCSAQPAGEDSHSRIRR